MFGLNPATYFADPKPLWWGIRSIYNRDFTFDILHDRQQFSDYSDDTRAERQAIVKWLDTRGRKLLVKRLRGDDVHPGDNRVVHLQDGRFNVVASPKASHGYLYLGLWREPPAAPEYFTTTYCNFAHRLSDGKPVEHECRIIPPAALAAERDGDIGRALAILSAHPVRIMRRGVKRT